MSVLSFQDPSLSLKTKLLEEHYGVFLAELTSLPATRKGLGLPDTTAYSVNSTNLVRYCSLCVSQILPYYSSVFS
jgi:hypothetical protein